MVGVVRVQRRHRCAFALLSDLKLEADAIAGAETLESPYRSTSSSR